MGAHRPIGAIAQTFARADLVLVGPGRATASLAGDSPRPGAVRAMQCSVGDGMLGPLPPTHARLRTPPHGRAKWEPRGPLVQSRRLLHGRIWPWPGPTVPRPRWSGISLGQEQFGPCQQGPGRWTMGWRGLPKFCASPETLWLLGVIFNKKLRIYYRGGQVARA